MNPGEEDVLDNINQFVVPNGNNEITASVLNPILNEIVEQSNSVDGELSQLATSTQSNLVSAINEIYGLVNNNTGIQLYEGLDDPNDTPPTTYNIADFYIQKDISNNPIQLWQYNGVEWVRANSIFLQNSGYKETKFPYIGSLNFTLPNNVEAIIVKKNGNPAENKENWSQLGNVVTYLGTMESGDYLLITGVYVIPSGGGGGSPSLEDAPSDGLPYVRRDGGWEDLTPDLKVRLSIYGNIYEDITAVINGHFNVIADCAITSPTPIDGKGYYQVHVVNGTATIDGVAYGAGSLVLKTWYDGEWKVDVYGKVISDGTTITGDGTISSPLVAVGGGGGGSSSWGGITGNLSDQTDLQTALNNKLDKETTNDGIEKVYIKNADGTQGMKPSGDTNLLSQNIGAFERFSGSYSRYTLTAINGGSSASSSFDVLVLTDKNYMNGISYLRSSPSVANSGAKLSHVSPIVRLTTGITFFAVFQTYAKTDGIIRFGFPHGNTFTSNVLDLGGGVWINIVGNQVTAQSASVGLTTISSAYTTTVSETLLLLIEIKLDAGVRKAFFKIKRTDGTVVLNETISTNLRGETCTSLQNGCIATYTSTPSVREALVSVGAMGWWQSKPNFLKDF